MAKITVLTKISAKYPRRRRLYGVFVEILII
jgi:hypothetical protein